MICQNHIARLLAILFGILLILSGCGGTPINIDIPPRDQQITCPTLHTGIPWDPGKRGPWAVGARTVDIPNTRWGTLRTEIWYPAVAGTEQGKPRKTYDLREYLPQQYAKNIPDDAAPFQECDCYDHLPLDTENGPYPVIVFIHGFASFRTQSTIHNTHWASRGFVVISADHPNIQLRDILSDLFLRFRATQAQDAVDIIRKLQHPDGELSFLANHIDMNRVGVSGHSAGATAASKLGSVPGVRVAVLMSGREANTGEYIRSVLILGAENDAITPYSGQINAYESSAIAVKRLVGIANSGHMAFTEMCTLLEDQGGILAFAKRYGVPVSNLFETLGSDGCDPSQTPPEDGWEIINYTATSVFEETLQCAPDRRSDFEDITARFGAVLEYQEEID